MSSLEIILTNVAVLTASAAVLLVFVLMKKKMRETEEKIKAQVQARIKSTEFNVHKSAYDRAKSQLPPLPTNPDGLTEKEVWDTLEKEYPYGFKTTYLGQTVWVLGRRYDVLRDKATVKATVVIAWWDGFKHVKEHKIEVGSFKLLHKILEPKKHYVGVDPAPIDDDEGVPA